MHNATNPNNMHRNSTGERPCVRTHLTTSLHQQLHNFNHPPAVMPLEPWLLRLPAPAAMALLLLALLPLGRPLLCSSCSTSSSWVPPTLDSSTALVPAVCRVPRGTAAAAAGAATAAAATAAARRRRGAPAAAAAVMPAPAAFSAAVFALTLTLAPAAVGCVICCTPVLVWPLLLGFPVLIRIIRIVSVWWRIAADVIPLLPAPLAPIVLRIPSLRAPPVPLRAPVATAIAPIPAGHAPIVMAAAMPSHVC